jgi:hypothetical protein
MYHNKLMGTLNASCTVHVRQRLLTQDARLCSIQNYQCLASPCNPAPSFNSPLWLGFVLVHAWET